MRRKLIYILIASSLLIASLMSAFLGSNQETIQLAKYDYQKSNHSRCEAGSRLGMAGKSNNEETSFGIHFNVRTPLNYDNTVQHPLLIVYAPAGHNRFANEKFAGLTQVSTAHGFIIAYIDNYRLSLPAFKELSTIPKQIGNKWCIDSKRIFLTGHSDGGTISNAIGFLPNTKHIPQAIAPSAVGIRQEDMSAYECPEPVSVMMMQKAGDTLFPNYSKELAEWWASCNMCDKQASSLGNSCMAYSNCAQNVKTWFCETPGQHHEWPPLNKEMIDFLMSVPPRGL